MGRIEKTVFISYRRTDKSWAQAVFGDLTQHGYDVFIDYDGIASGNFETAILENIRARAHFLVLLTPSALEPRKDSVDWMRREIEAALDSQRNIVPLMLGGFDFHTSATQLTGKLTALKKCNGLPIPAGFFQEAMGRLRNRFLNVPVDAVLHTASDSAQQIAKEQQDKATTAVGDEQIRRVQERDNVIPGKDTEIDELQIKSERTEKTQRFNAVIGDGAPDRRVAADTDHGRYARGARQAETVASARWREASEVFAQQHNSSHSRAQGALLRRRSSPSVTGVA